jgi:hypothetical protein
VREWFLDDCEALVRERRFRALVLQNSVQISMRDDVIRDIRANEVLAPSSLVPQIIRSCAKNVFSHSFR